MRYIIRLSIDQGLSSLSLFIFSITLAREFGAADFSIYAIALSTSLMVTAIFNSAYIEPTALRGKGGLSRGTIITKLSILSLIASMLCLFFIEQSQFIPVMAFTVGNSVLFTVRRINALNGEHNKLTLVSATSFALTMTLLWSLNYTQASLDLWLISYGTLGVIYLLFLPAIKYESKEKVAADLSSLVTAIMLWICSNYFFYYLPAVGRADESGQLRVIYTLFMPILQAGTIAGSFLISRKSTHNAALPITLSLTAVYGLTLIGIGSETIHSITKIPITTQELAYATLLAAANSSSGLLSISLRMQKYITPILTSSTISALMLIISGFLAKTLNEIMICITLSFLLSIALSQAIRRMQK